MDYYAKFSYILYLVQCLSQVWALNLLRASQIFKVKACTAPCSGIVNYTSHYYHTQLLYSEPGHQYLPLLSDYNLQALGKNLPHTLNKQHSLNFC